MSVRISWRCTLAALIVAFAAAQSVQLHHTAVPASHEVVINLCNGASTQAETCSVVTDSWSIDIRNVTFGSNSSIIIAGANSSQCDTSNASPVVMALYGCTFSSGVSLQMHGTFCRTTVTVNLINSGYPLDVLFRDVALLQLSDVIMSGGNIGAVAFVGNFFTAQTWSSVRILNASASIGQSSALAAHVNVHSLSRSSVVSAVKVLQLQNGSGIVVSNSSLSGAVEFNFTAAGLVAPAIDILSYGRILLDRVNISSPRGDAFTIDFRGTVRAAMHLNKGTIALHQCNLLSGTGGHAVHLAFQNSVGMVLLVSNESYVYVNGSDVRGTRCGWLCSWDHALNGSTTVEFDSRISIMRSHVVAALEDAVSWRARASTFVSLELKFDSALDVVNTSLDGRTHGFAVAMGDSAHTSISLHNSCFVGARFLSALKSRVADAFSIALFNTTNASFMVAAGSAIGTEEAVSSSTAAAHFYNFSLSVGLLLLVADNAFVGARYGSTLVGTTHGIRFSLRGCTYTTMVVANSSMIGVRSDSSASATNPILFVWALALRSSILISNRSLLGASNRVQLFGTGDSSCLLFDALKTEDVTLNISDGSMCGVTSSVSMFVENANCFTFTISDSIRTRWSVVNGSSISVSDSSTAISGKWAAFAVTMSNVQQLLLFVGSGSLIGVEANVTIAGTVCVIVFANVLKNSIVRIADASVVGARHCALCNFSSNEAITLQLLSSQDTVLEVVNKSVLGFGYVKHASHQHATNHLNGVVFISFVSSTNFSVVVDSSLVGVEDCGVYTAFFSMRGDSSVNTTITIVNTQPGAYSTLGFRGNVTMNSTASTSCASYINFNSAVRLKLSVKNLGAVFGTHGDTLQIFVGHCLCLLLDKAAQTQVTVHSGAVLGISNGATVVAFRGLIISANPSTNLSLSVVDSASVLGAAHNRTSVTATTEVVLLLLKGSSGFRLLVADGGAVGARDNVNVVSSTLLVFDCSFFCAGAAVEVAGVRSRIGVSDRCIVVVRDSVVGVDARSSEGFFFNVRNGGLVGATNFLLKNLAWTIVWFMFDGSNAAVVHVVDDGTLGAAEANISVSSALVLVTCLLCSKLEIAVNSTGAVLGAIGTTSTRGSVVRISIPQCRVCSCAVSGGVIGAVRGSHASSAGIFCVELDLTNTQSCAVRILNGGQIGGFGNVLLDNFEAVVVILLVNAKHSLVLADTGATVGITAGATVVNTQAVVFFSLHSSANASVIVSNSSVIGASAHCRCNAMGYLVVIRYTNSTDALIQLQHQSIVGILNADAFLTLRVAIALEIDNCTRCNLTLISKSTVGVFGLSRVSAEHGVYISSGSSSLLHCELRDSSLIGAGHGASLFARTFAVQLIFVAATNVSIRVTNSSCIGAVGGSHTATMESLTGRAIVVGGRQCSNCTLSVDVLSAVGILVPTHTTNSSVTLTAYEEAIVIFWVASTACGISVADRSYVGYATLNDSDATVVNVRGGISLILINISMSQTSVTCTNSSLLGLAAGSVHLGTVSAFTLDASYSHNSALTIVDSRIGVFAQVTIQQIPNIDVVLCLLLFRRSTEASVVLRRSRLDGTALFASAGVGIIGTLFPATGPFGRLLVRGGESTTMQVDVSSGSVFGFNWTLFPAAFFMPMVHFTCVQCVDGPYVSIRSKSFIGIANIFVVATLGIISAPCVLVDVSLSNNATLLVSNASIEVVSSTIYSSTTLLLFNLSNTIHTDFSISQFGAVKVLHTTMTATVGPLLHFDFSKSNASLWNVSEGSAVTLGKDSHLSATRGAVIVISFESTSSALWKLERNSSLEVYDTTIYAAQNASCVVIQLMFSTSFEITVSGLGSAVVISNSQLIGGVPLSVVGGAHSAPSSPQILFSNASGGLLVTRSVFSSETSKFLIVSGRVLLVCPAPPCVKTEVSAYEIFQSPQAGEVSVMEWEALCTGCAISVCSTVVWKNASSVFATKPDIVNVRPVVASMMPAGADISSEGCTASASPSKSASWTSEGFTNSRSKSASWARSTSVSLSARQPSFTASNATASLSLASATVSHSTASVQYSSQSSTADLSLTLHLSGTSETSKSSLLEETCTSSVSRASLSLELLTLSKSRQLSLSSSPSPSPSLRSTMSWQATSTKTFLSTATTALSLSQTQQVAVGTASSVLSTTFGASTSATSLVSSVVIPVAALSMQRLALLTRLSNCDSDLPTAAEVLSDDIAFVDSPLQLRVGPVIGSMHRGAVLGNITVWCAAVAIGFILTRILQRIRRRKNLVDTAAHLRLPGLFFIVVALVLQQTVVSAILLLGNRLDTWQRADVAIGASAVVLVSLLYVAMMRVLDPRPRAFRAIANGALRRRDRWPIWTLQSIIRWLVAVRYRWRARDLENDKLFVQRYGFLFEGCKRGMHWWLMVEVSVTVVLSVIAGIVPTSEASCRVLLWSSVAVCTASLALTLLLRPMDSRLEAIVLVALSVTQLVVAACTAAGSSSGVVLGLGLIGAIFSAALVLISLIAVVRRATSTALSAIKPKLLPATLNEQDAHLPALFFGSQQNEINPASQRCPEYLSQHSVLARLVRIICSRQLRTACGEESANVIQITANR